MTTAGSVARRWVVIPAAGQGARMEADIPKQYLPLLGRSVLEHALHCFLDRDDVAGIVVVLAADDAHWKQLPSVIRSRIIPAPGGGERHESVCNGLSALDRLADKEDWVLVHDAARPCLRQSDLDHLLASVPSRGAGGLLAVPVQDTLKRADGRRRVLATVDRGGLWRAQTPQMFRLGSLRAALSAAQAAGVRVTDEAMVMERAGAKPLLVPGHPDNIKITSRQDLVLAEAILARRAHQAEAEAAQG